MRRGIGDIRAAVARALPAFSWLSRQKGMFSTLPLSEKTIDNLRESHAIYMIRNGRINLAGLAARNGPRFAECLRAAA